MTTFCSALMPPSNANSTSSDTSSYKSWCDNNTHSRVKAWRNKVTEHYTLYPFNPSSKSDDSHPLHWYLSELCKKYDMNGFPELCVGFIEEGNFFSPRQYLEEITQNSAYDEDIIGEILMNMPSDCLPDNPCPFDINPLDLDSRYTSVGWIILKGDPDTSSYDYSCIASDNMTDSYNISLSKYGFIQIKDPNYEDDIVAHYRNFYIGEEMHYTLYNDD
jgi:hypothetical protein